ncbi:TetR/AcrR family transcriptional regulator [Terriglobus aquaticus]|uniref:TetR/AcrR family transcriptional regulator n=1 Tax=Terriglobus aquaticus TaxID=940139 RepID=A0ABW9KJ81_9BACT|nr:TetR/AcrR family transcriptional regulator [Terriglobus aquaticus]
MEAILDATLQVLTKVGKEQLTTTRVASRAGVSVGTLYQYFPNKVSLLQACLRRHMDQVVAAMRDACNEQKGSEPIAMVDGLVEAYLAAKMHHIPSSAALYSISSDVDGMEIAKAAYATVRSDVTAMFATAPHLKKSPESVASIVLAAMNGVARRLLEAEQPEAELPNLRDELELMLHSYLKACCIAG